MSPVALKLFPFLAWRERVTAWTLRKDAIAGLVGALVVLPQGVAYATLAGLPPQYGLYCAIVPAIVAALWGSSWHQVSGPTNAMALVVFATMAPLALPGSATYIQLVLTLAFLVGALQLALGLARLGTLVNFISHTVIVGFTAGAGLLIIAAQLSNFSGIEVPADANFFAILHAVGTNIRTLDPWICATGVVTLVAAAVAKQSLPAGSVHDRRDDRGQRVRVYRRPRGIRQSCPPSARFRPGCPSSRCHRSIRMSGGNWCRRRWR